MNKLSEVNGK